MLSAAILVGALRVKMNDYTATNFNYFNPTALKKAKIAYNFGLMSAIGLTKGGNFLDFLFARLENEALPNGVYSNITLNCVPAGNSRNFRISDM